MPYKDKEKQKRYQAKWRLNHPLYFKRWMSAHPQKKKKKNKYYWRQYRKDNKDICLRIAQRYRLNNRISYLKKARKWRLSHPLERKRQQQRNKSMRKQQGGNISIKIIQLIYEDNIKKYGALTCYLCLNPIRFGEDSLEHKIPLSRGGTNLYNNLAIACQKCNSKKHTKTEKEYRRIYGKDNRSNKNAQIR